MKKLFLAAAFALTLTGCGEPVEQPKDRYEICLEHGGSWDRGAWGETCTLPGEKNDE